MTQANGSTITPASAPVKRDTPFVYAHSRIPSPDGLPELVEAIEQDHQFLLGIRVLKALASTIRVTVKVANGDARAQRLAANLEEVWAGALPDMMQAFAYGRAAFERTYEIKHGLATLQPLLYLPFEDTELRIDAGGNFEGVVVQPQGADKPLILSAIESWWAAIDATVKIPHGKSRYLGAVTEVWKARRALDRNEEVWMRKFGLGHGVGKAPSKYPHTADEKGDLGQVGRDAQVRNPMNDTAEGIEGLASGDVLVLDSAVGENGQPLFSYDPPTTRQDATPLSNQRQTLDDAALSALGVTARSVSQNADVGTNAMATTHMEVTFATVEDIVGQLATAFQSLIDDAVAWNWQPGAAPTLTFDWQSLSHAADRDGIKSIVRTMIQSPALSPLIVHGAIDLSKLLELAELPTGPDVMASLLAIREAATVAPPVAGPVQMSLADTPVPITPPVQTPTDESIAARAIREDEPLLRELEAALAGDPEHIDRGRL